MTDFATTSMRLSASAFTGNYLVFIVSTQIPKSENLIGLVYLYLCSAFSCLDMLAIYGLVPTIVLIGEDVVLDNVKQKLVIKGCATAVTIDRVVIFRRMRAYICRNLNTGHI